MEKSDVLIDDCKITTSKKYMLSQFLYYCSKNKIDIEEYLLKFENAINKIYSFSKTAFNSVDREKNKIAKSVHEVTAEALIITIMLGNEINVTEEEFNRNKISYWIQTSNNDNPFYSTTTNKESVMKRIDIMKLLVGKTYE